MNISPSIVDKSNVNDKCCNDYDHIADIKKVLEKVNPEINNNCN